MKKLFIIITAIAIMVFGLSMIFKPNLTTLISVERSGIGVLYYKFDIIAYKNAIQDSITDTAVLNLTLPTKTMIGLEGADWYEDLAYDLCVIVDYIIFGLNIIIYPMRIGGYLIKNILAILGMNVNNPDQSNPIYWLINLANVLAGLQIPYTPNNI